MSSFEKKWEAFWFDCCNDITSSYIDDSKSRDEANNHFKSALEMLFNEARILGAQEALQRVEGEVIGSDDPQMYLKDGSVIKNDLRAYQRTKLAKLREEMK